ncbi:MAG: PAS domain-containing protein [Chloroflexaceae bacterium]|nr:PAS domain-containing protein [Chloroflexaceae bacterium]NJO05826.1 PAS domain-containing protein [Chloroflexaceae bacterium]
MKNDTSTVENLQEENARLRQRLTELEQSDTLLYAILEYIPLLLFIKDTKGRHLALSRWYEIINLVERNKVLGKTDSEIVDETGPSAEIVERYRQEDIQVMETGQPSVQEFTISGDFGQVSTYASIKFPLYDRKSQIIGVAGIATDITEQRISEQQRAALQQQLLDAQERRLRELSTPLIPITEGVIVMPLIGIIDANRSQQILETLLEGVARYQAETAMLDITGVPTVNDQVAHTLLQAARAVRLLGAQIVLTGIQPTLAHTLVTLGIDLQGIVTYSSLQEAVRRTLVAD